MYGIGKACSARKVEKGNLRHPFFRGLSLCSELLRLFEKLLNAQIATLDGRLIAIGEQSQRTHRIFVAFLLDLREQFLLRNMALNDVGVTTRPRVDGPASDISGGFVADFETLFPNFFQRLAEERLVERPIGEILRVELRVTRDERLLFVIAHLASMGNEIVISRAESRPVQTLLHEIEPLRGEKCEFHEKLFRDVGQHIGRVGGKRVTTGGQTAEDGATFSAVDFEFEVIFAQCLHDARHTLSPFEHQDIAETMKGLGGFGGRIATLQFDFKEMIDISVHQIASALGVTNGIYRSTRIFLHFFHLFQAQRSAAMLIGQIHHRPQTAEILIFHLREQLVFADDSMRKQVQQDCRRKFVYILPICLAGRLSPSAIEREHHRGNVVKLSLHVRFAHMDDMPQREPC